MTPRQLRSKLQTRLLSTMPRASADEIIVHLEQLAFRQGEVDVAPSQAWVGESKDTLCVTADGQLLGALVIQELPFFDPLILRADIPWPALVVEFLRIRAEGILQAHGHDEYRVAVPRGMLASWQRYLVDSSPETKEAVGSDLLVYRREL